MELLDPSCVSSSRRGMARHSRAGGQQLVAPLRVDLSACKYDLLRSVAGRLGWQVVPAGSSDSQWDLFWTDTSISQERLLRLAPTQRINHFHGMLELCRKRSMARLLAGLAAATPAGCSYDFFPATWQLPGQLRDFLAAAKAAGRKATFIVKPDAGCQGKGIKLLQGGNEAAVLRNLAGMATLQAVAQAYIPQPLLIHGLKFDLRVYVLVADVDPLRVFIYKEGLARFCTAPYTKPTSKNLGCAYMHLTNYAVNKHNAEAFVAPGSSGGAASVGSCAADSSSGDEAEGDQAPAQQQGRAGGPTSGAGTESASKWSFNQLRQHLESQGHSWSGLWASISQLVVKSLAAAAPHLAATYRTTVVSNGSSATASRAGPAATGTSSCSSPKVGSSASAAVSSAAVAAGCCRCFEVLGYDVLLDAGLKPWLVEVNHSPSFNTDSQLDKSIKEALIIEAVRLLRIEPASIAAAKQAARKATQARLVAPPPARGSSSAAGGPSSSGCSADAKAAQQAHREAIIAARDKWQDRHLGNFERIYPVSIPGQQAGTSKAAATATPTASPAKLAELAQLQQTYDQLLAVSQQLYSQQQQQQQAHQLRLQQQQPAANLPVRHRGQAKSTGCMTQQQQPPQQQQQQLQQQVESCKQLWPRMELQAQQRQQDQQGADDDVQPAQCSCNGSDDDEQGPVRGQPCSDTAQHVSVASALALLTAALARPDVPSLHRSRPASASSSQQISRAACSLSRPQSARATSICGTSATTGVRNAQLCKLTQHHTAAVPHTSQDSSALHSFRSNSSSTSASSSNSNNGSRGTLCLFAQRSIYGSNGASAQQQAAARPRPASAPRLRSCRVVSSNFNNTHQGDVDSGRLVRPWSSRSSRRGAADAGNPTEYSTASSVGVPVCVSKQSSACSQRHAAVTATTQSRSSDSSSYRQRSNSCGRVQKTERAEIDTAGDSMHCSSEDTNAGTAPPIEHPAPPVVWSSGAQHHSSNSLSVIAAAVQEATAALDAAVAGTFSTATTPRPASLDISVVAVDEIGAAVGCTASLMLQNTHTLKCNINIKAAHGLTKGPLQSIMHSRSIGAVEQVHQQQQQQRQQLQQQCSLKLGSSCAHGSAYLARFSSFPGSRQMAPTMSKAVPESNNSRSRINSLLQQRQATRGVAESLTLAAADAAAIWSTCAVPAASCSQRQGVQRSSSQGATGSSLNGVHRQCDGRQHLAGAGAGPPLQSPSSQTCQQAEGGMAGAVVVGSSIQSSGQRPLLRHCSTGGLLGRLRLAHASTDAG